MQLVPVAVAIFLKKLNDGTYETWVQERTYGELKGQWEFPGGKIETSETPWDALVREIHEETRVIVQGQGRLLGIYPHDYGQKRVLLHVFCVPWEASLAEADGKTVPLRPATTGREWNVSLLPANYALVEHLCRALYSKGNV